MSISIDAIDEKMSEAGIETMFYSDDEFTSYTIANGGQAIELFDAVSGDSFRSEHLTSAAYYTDQTGKPTADVTASFENAETMDEFVTAVNDIFGTIK